MRRCDFISFIVCLSIGLCAVLLTLGFGIAGTGWIFILGSSLIAVGSLAWPAVLVFRIDKSFRSIMILLKEEESSVDKQDIGPVEAIKTFASQAQRRQEELKKNHADLALQIQLLQKQKINTEAIIYSIRDAVIVVDSFERVILANAAAEKVFGFDFDQSVLKPLAETVDNPELAALISTSRHSEVGHVKHELQVESGEDVRTFDCIISCVKDSKNEVNGIVVVMHDVTREKEIAQMKNDFVSHVSHELKTPLASINAYAEMLVDGEAEDTETIHQFCSIIQTQAQRLNRLIEDILNISRIESGLIKVDKSVQSLTILIRDAVEMITSYAQEKDITVNTPAQIVFDQVYADKDMISQVIINLLSNAVKYTKNGGSVSVESVVDEADQLVRVTVTDTGVGIPPDDVEHVFDKFYRVEANKKVAKGTGLGLNLVKQIVEKVHDGRVFVSSTQGEGSTFGFELPLNVNEPAKTA